MKLNFKSINWTKLTVEFIIRFILIITELAIITAFCWIGLHQIKDIINIINANKISIGSAFNIAIWIYPMYGLFYFFNKINNAKKEFFEEKK